MSYDGTLTFTGGVATIGDVAEPLYRKDLAGTGPTGSFNATSLVEWDGNTFEVVEDAVGDVVIYKNGSNMNVDPTVKVGHQVNISDHTFESRILNAYAVGSATKGVYNPIPGPISGSGSWVITYLDDELAITNNLATHNPQQIGFPSESGEGQRLTPPFKPWKNFPVFPGTTGILASDPSGLHDADRMPAGTSFEYSDYAPLTMFALNIFWPKVTGSRDGLCAVNRTGDWDAKWELWKAEVVDPAATEASIAAAKAAMRAEQTIIYNNFVPDDLIDSLENDNYIVVDHV
jgi:hypothetical protein